ncbi:MAG: oxidoreductase, partial [Alphaproteobacteria bacterium]
MPDLQLKVTVIEELTPSIKRFELVRAVGGELPPFQAGAHINVRTC